MFVQTDLVMQIHPHDGMLEGVTPASRTLAALRECFADQVAYDALLAHGDQVVYHVSSVEPAQGDGQLHYGLGMLMPGKVGAEYFMTKGHFHTWRAAAEVYVGLSGMGAMLLEEEGSGETQCLPLGPNSVVYVPGFTAHRTINTGREPLVYLGMYPASAGHDYGTIAERNFAHVLVDVDGQPTLLERSIFLATLQGAHQ